MGNADVTYLKDKIKYSRESDTSGKSFYVLCV